MSPAPAAQENRSPGRLALLRDALVFQLKLFMDGFRDLLLSPVSILIAGIDLLTGGDRFYRLLALGRRTELWIDLFGDRKDAGLDEAVARLEQVVAEQYRRGDIQASARASLDRALGHLAQNLGLRERGEDRPDPADPGVD